jgi:superfamily II DNA or RNA helicase
MITLRPYQTQLLDDIRKAFASHKRVVAVMPTGAGKGQTIAAVIAAAIAKGSTVLVVAHRAELVAQLSATVKSWGIEHGVIAPGHRMTYHPCQVGSVQTVVRRFDRMTIVPDLIIVDEAHHLVAGNQWGRLVERYPDAYLLGKTATPERLSGEGLGEGHGGYFQAMVLGPTAEWLTANGFLAAADVYSIPGNLPELHKRAGDYIMGEAAESVVRLHGDAIKHFRAKVPADGTALTFCCTVAHAEQVAADFNAAGIPAASLDGTMAADDRRALLDRLRARELRVVTSCMVLGEGVDIPGVSAAILLRPTASTSLYLQMVGRALRPKPDGSRAVILDHVGNALRHGLPTDHREWSLEGRPKRKREDGPSVRVCPDCFAAMPSGTAICPACGVPQVTKQREIATTEGDLQLLTRRAVPRPVPSAGARTYEDLLAIEKERGYRHGWAKHVMNHRLSRSPANRRWASRASQQLSSFND